MTAGGEGLARLNRMPAGEAERALLACCGSRRWVAEMAAERPYPTTEALHEAAERTWWALAEPDWQEAFAAHPRIGDRARASATERQEQQGAATASAATLQELAEGNNAYEERFGRVFLVCAAGRTADEMLALLHQRLRSDPATELRTAATEQSRITRLRLERMLA